MIENIFDLVKAVVVLLLLASAIMVLPFFLTALIAIILIYVTYIIIRAVRLNKEKEKANAEANHS